MVTCGCGAVGMLVCVDNVGEGCVWSDWRSGGVHIFLIVGYSYRYDINGVFICARWRIQQCLRATHALIIPNILHTRVHAHTRARHGDTCLSEQRGVEGECVEVLPGHVGMLVDVGPEHAVKHQIRQRPPG